MYLCATAREVGKPPPQTVQAKQQIFRPAAGWRERGMAVLIRGTVGGPETGGYDSIAQTFLRKRVARQTPPTRHISSGHSR